MDGTSEWTEMGAEQGLDHLAMLSPVEAHYQSLVRGFSSVTTRLRNYSFYAFWVVHYKRQVRNDARRVFEDRTRRVEALYALAAAQRTNETGVAGSTFADEKIEEGGDPIDFRVETDYETPQKNRYLAPRGGAFPGVYFGQMSEMGLIGRGKRHGLPVPDEPCYALADAYAASHSDFIDGFLRCAEVGQVTRAELEPMVAMAPSSLDQESDEAAILRRLLMGEDGADLSINRRATLLAILEIAKQTDSGTEAESPSVKITEDMLRWWFIENEPNGAHADIHRSWQHYQVGDMVRLVYESLLNHAISVLEDFNEGLPAPELVSELVADIPGVPLEVWLTTLAEGPESLRELQARGMVHDAPLGDILAPLARLWRDWRHRLGDLGESYKEAPGQQTCFTELRWIEAHLTDSAETALGQLLFHRVLRRHLEVAARKFRIQTSYTYLIEVEEARLRARGKVNVNPSGPRLATAIRFLEDVDLLKQGRITPRGLAYLEAAL
ncbi:hypothetical protein [Alterinioella nitratireducens]|uniref:hypothetical protein n=1 Tax=Alterinioella nitratireducens TaxID=2735915 RepID=UPI001553D5D8|nr:hypothetical protein [Alterinioella nitratireducens]NPD21665.1 hypothetical protein [Alterinioella nitratireducens]